MTRLLPLSCAVTKACFCFLTNASYARSVVSGLHADSKRLEPIVVDGEHRPAPWSASDCNLRGYGVQSGVIIRFRHKGLRLLYEKGDRRRIPSEHAGKVERIMARLDEARTPGDMNLPGFRLHPLRGDLLGYWSISISGNWRIIFRFDNANVCDVDLVDYH